MQQDDSYNKYITKILQSVKKISNNGIKTEESLSYLQPVAISM